MLSKGKKMPLYSCRGRNAAKLTQIVHRKEYMSYISPVEDKAVVRGAGYLFHLLRKHSITNNKTFDWQNHAMTKSCNDKTKQWQNHAMTKSCNDKTKQWQNHAMTEPWRTLNTFLRSTAKDSVFMVHMPVPSGREIYPTESISQSCVL